MSRAFILIAIIGLLCGVYSKPIFTKIPPPEAFKFMKQFGYLEQGPLDSEALYSEDAITDAIKNVQKFGAIPQTGVIDNATLKLMSSPRCGVPDVVRVAENRRQKRYVLAAPGWKKRNVTYFVANWSPKIGEEAVQKYMQVALDTWGRYARLTFTHVPDPAADIIVAFGRGPHGDGYPFDGPGNILAHAFFPYEFGSFGGDIHFDDDENWMINPKEEDDGVDFFTVAVHELGHSLGLGHSPVPDSIMFPYYKGYSNSFALGYDDILAMYQLYISRTLEGDESTTENSVTTSESPETTERTRPTEKTTERSSTESYSTTKSYPTTEGYSTTERYSTTGRYSTTITPRSTSRYPKTKPTYTPRTYPPTSTVTYEGDYETVDQHKEHEVTPRIPGSTMAPYPDICKGYYDAIGVLRGELFVFKDEYVWRLREKGSIEEGYPVKFRQLFPKLPESIKRIDATYQRETDGHIILFTGNKYWDFDGDNFVNGSPRPLTDYGLPAILDKIDAAQVWNKNHKTYLFRNEMFWRYNETTKLMDPGYPHHIRRWRGVPADLDAATTWTDGFTYFFKGNLFWRFDNYLIKTDEHYPLPAPQNWLGCPEKPDTFWFLPPYN